MDVFLHEVSHQFYFIFITILSIEAGSDDELRGTFHLESLDVHIKGTQSSFNHLCLKSSMAKRIAPTWLHFQRQFVPVPAGQVQAAAQMSSDG